MSDNPLETFAREATPSPALQRRVEASLRRRGLLAKGPPWRLAGFAASLVLALGAGYIAGRAGAAPPSHGGRQYLLLLREDSSYRDDRPVDEIVREYAQWANSLRRNDLLVMAEKLGDEEASVGGAASSLTSAAESPTTGFFLVRAPDLAAAQAIAASSPHIRYGGRIVVRSVE